MQIVIHKKEEDMQYQEAIERLNDFLSSGIISSSFGNIETHEAIKNDAPIISLKIVDLPKDGIGHESGVYFLYSPSGEVYYIGKATRNNLHEEVWGKIKTPSKNDDNTFYYPKNYFLNKNNLDKNAVNDVTTGNIKIGVITISNNILSSLSEVYLQTLYCQNNAGNLPKLNSQIG